MGKKKSTQTSTATYGYVPHQATADEDAWRKYIQGVDFSTPVLNSYGQMANEVNDTMFEDQLPPGVAEQIKYGRMFDLNQRKGAALSNAKASEAQFKSGAMGGLASMTQNPFVQTGGTALGTQSGASLGDWLGFGASVAGA